MGLAPSQSLRSAETSELSIGTIEVAPVTNTAPVPLIATCPNCQGDEDEEPGTHASGHARICWNNGDKIDTIHMRTDCSGGTKALLCVTKAMISNTSPGWM